MIIRILETAEREIRRISDRYNEESPGLGYEFLDEFLNTTGRIQRNPEAWQALSRRARRALTRRFPYGVIYQIRKSEILIVAVMHLHRHPDAWKSGRQSF
ncbi:MAG TPA: type II toxin-antitoxin system RelE/ParE family toxin [Kiritimatiellia bacterium]|nr:type II toxin-antitoxin system RelE/ParE family toxin [Kiritimatiellia bacterium]